MVEDRKNILLLPLLKSAALLLFNRIVREYEILLLRCRVGVDAIVNDEREGTRRLLLLLHVRERSGQRAPRSNAVESQVVSVPVVEL